MGRPAQLLRQPRGDAHHPGAALIEEVRRPARRIVVRGQLVERVDVVVDGGRRGLGHVLLQARTGRALLVREEPGALLAQVPVAAGRRAELLRSGAEPVPQLP